ncbi:hypothetical protein F5Y16DRAFT_185038 [Xylariaceae sp. FL0255]|nr:hypothetical protein F5Y16DRAFT_185038 [Xylariaceae sp. FL0255]
MAWIPRPKLLTTSSSYAASSTTPSSSNSTEAQTQELYDSLARLKEERQQRRLPSIVLGALLTLFVSSAGGIALAIVLMTTNLVTQDEATAKGAEAACLSRDLVLFAGAMALLYIILHIRGARTEYRRVRPGAPQLYGNYLHASALVVCRLAIVVWLAALVATIVLIVRAVPFKGFIGKVPFLNLVICTGAIPSFIVISATIEKNPTPFATAAISRPSFLTCRVSEFADDLAASDMLSVSRRASLQRKEERERESQQKSGGSVSVLTLPTEEILRVNTDERARVREVQIVVDDAKTELMTSSPMRETHEDGTKPVSKPSSSVPPIPKIPELPPQTYVPGGWRSEWNNVAQEVGVSQIASNSSADGSNTTYTTTTNHPTSYSSSFYGSQPTSSSATTVFLTEAPSRTEPTMPPKHHVTATTSIASSAARSRLSTVRYASEPEIAVCQPMQVVEPGSVSSFVYSHATKYEGGRKVDDGASVSKPEPVALLRMAQRAQKSGGGEGGLRRQPSNFSRPIIQKGQGGNDGADSRKGGLKVPGAYVEDEVS